MSWRINGSRHVEDSLVRRFCHPFQYIHGWGIRIWKTSSLPMWLVMATMPSKVPSVSRDRSGYPLSNISHHPHSPYIYNHSGMLQLTQHRRGVAEIQQSRFLRDSRLSISRVTSVRVRCLEPSTCVLLHIPASPCIPYLPYLPYFGLSSSVASQIKQNNKYNRRQSILLLPTTPTL